MMMNLTAVSISPVNNHVIIAPVNVAIILQTNDLTNTRFLVYVMLSRCYINYFYLLHSSTNVLFFNTRLAMRTTHANPFENPNLFQWVFGSTLVNSQTRLVSYLNNCYKHIITGVDLYDTRIQFRTDVTTVSSTTCSAPCDDRTIGL